MKFLISIRKSMFAAVDAYINPGVYARPSREEFRKDQMRLRGDVVKVGNDMRQAITKYDERAYQSQGD